MRSFGRRTQLLIFVAIAAMVVVFAAATIVAVQLRRAQFAEDGKAAWRDSVAGLVFGYEREYARFFGELGVAARAAEAQPADLERLRLRYEILLSRVELLRSSSSLELLRGVPEYGAVIQAMSILKGQADALLEEDRAPQRAELQRLLQTADSIFPAVQGYTRAATSMTAEIAERHVKTLQQQAEMILGLAALQLLLAGGAAAMVWLNHREQAQAREQLQALADELREAKVAADTGNRTKSQFLANMSHELRTPFQGVIGMLQLLDQSQPTSAQRELIRTARESADHLLNLLNDVLDMSAIEAGRVELESKPLNLHRLCQDAQQLMRGQATNRGLRLTCRVAPGVPVWVLGDATRVKQVIFNLLSNAIKFTPSGEIVLDVTADRTGALSFAVTDTGIGMDEATVARLFHRFGMGDDTLSRRFGGIGLGLEISRNLARRMHGDLTVESQAGRGSRFTFTAVLPACPVPTGETGADAALRGPDRALHVLVADDHPINRKYLALVLRSMGHTFTMCENGRQAYERAREERFDVVLMDVHMPVLDGLAATAAIRRCGGALARLPIVVLTADVMPETRERAEAAGVTACLSKPLDAARLADALEHAVEPEAAQTSAPAPLSSRFGELSAALSDELTGLVDMFFKDESRTIADLMEALEAGDSVRIPEAAHKLKGSARLLGFRRIAAVADDLENTRRPASEWQYALVQLRDAIDQTREALDSPREWAQKEPRSLTAV